jgi:hypothetical protein
MSISSKDFWGQFGKFVSTIPKPYVDALLVLHEKLDSKNIKWVVSGDLAELLRIIKVEPDFIEILTSKNDAHLILQAFQEFEPKQIVFQTQQLSRNALVEGKEYPVYARSYYFEFRLNTVRVKVEGDLQFKVDDWEWGDALDFTPEYVCVVGKKIAVTPLSIALQLYESLGWTDRVEKIREVTQRIRGQQNRNAKQR